MEAILQAYEQMERINVISISLRLLCAVLASMVVGLDRGRKRRPAGLKTHALVCIGSAMVMILSQFIYENLGYQGDMARMGAQVVSGIGFLGAGTILVTRQHLIRGLTTAAGLWCSACIGMAAGMGFYEGVLIASIFIWIVLKLLPRLENRVYGKSQLVDLYVELTDASAVPEVIAELKSCGCKLVDLNIERMQFGGTEGAALHITIYFSNRADHAVLLERLEKLEAACLVEEIG